MQSRRTLAKNGPNKGNMLDQKWFTYFLAGVLIILVLVFIVLLTPSYKQFVVDTAKSVFYGGKQEPPRPKASPARFQRSPLMNRF